uniref:Uncharacterized protein n=1 Tax=Strigamia maritima TaxID=126957 RepID=T1J492_STRMM
MGLSLQWVTSQLFFDSIWATERSPLSRRPCLSHRKRRGEKKGSFDRRAASSRTPNSYGSSGKGSDRAATAFLPHGTLSFHTDGLTVIQADKQKLARADDVACDLDVFFCF